MKRLTFILLLVLTLVPAYGQNVSCGIFGRVNDEKGKPMSYVAVSLRANDGAVITGTVTGDDGAFSVNVPSGQYILSAEFVGYEKQTRIVTVMEGNKNVGLIKMKEDVQALGEATVTAKAKSRKSNVERTSLSADANIAGAKGSVLDVLRSAPAVTVTDFGTVAVRGNSNVLVLLDGVPTTLTDLGAIPAANVKTVDIITNPDASHDSQGTGGIINVISKKESGIVSSSAGLSGIVSANYGFSHFANGNIALYNKGEKASWRLNLNSLYEDDIIDGSIKRTFAADGRTIYQQFNSAKTTFNSGLGFGTDFRLGKKDFIGANVKLSVPRIGTQQKLLNTIADISKENRYSDVSWNRECLDGGLNWRHLFGEENNEFRLSGNASKIQGHRPSFYYLENKLVNSSNSGGSPFLSSAQADLKFNLAPGSLETGVKMSFRRNSQYSVFSSLVNDVWEKSKELSSDLIHQEYVPAAYLLFSSKEDKAFSYKLGVRAEYSIVTLNSVLHDVDESAEDLFISPTFSSTYRISDKQSISLACSRRIGRPTYPQLNPYKNMIDAMTFEQGNMYLRPEKSDITDLAYSLKTGAVSLFADVFLNHTSDYITQIAMLEGDKLVTTFVNVDSDLKYGLDLSLKLTPAKWLEAAVNASTFHVDSHMEGNSDFDNGGWANNSNVQLDILPTKSTDIQLQYFISTPQHFPQFTTALNQYVNAGVKQSFCKGALTASALVTDILGTCKWETHFSGKEFSIDNVSRNKSRMLWLGLSYNFNSFKPQKAAKKADDDRSRINFGL